MSKSLVLVLSVVFAIFLIGILVFYKNLRVSEPSVITSFNDCLDAGNPIMESYPRQCRDAKGVLYVEDIGNALELSDQIQVSYPRPNDNVNSPIKITGQAIGSWLYEGQTDVGLYDSNGTKIATGLIIAKSNWMTEELVPFEGEIEFDVPPEEMIGKLVINKSNPSDLEENAAQLVIPLFLHGPDVVYTD